MKFLAKFSIILFVLTIIGVHGVKGQLLDPVKWKYETEKTDGKNVILKFVAKIDSGWHLYSQHVEPGGPLPTEFHIGESENFELVGKTSEPKPITEYDDVFKMDVLYFKDKAIFTQKISLNTEQAFLVKGYVDYMVCNEGSCIPFDKDFEFKIGDGPVKEEAKEEADGDVPAIEVDQIQVDSGQMSAVSIDDPDETDSAEESAIESARAVDREAEGDMIPKDGNLWVFFLISFLAGLAAILTPCVFPMIPMTVTFFMHNTESKIKAKLQAFTYGTSIIVIYTIAGTIVAVTLGVNFANWLSTHWIPNVFFFLIFVFFAASFLGMFELTLPSWLINKSDKQADKGGFTGAFFMAFTLVLVSFSCTGPIVGAILVESAGGQVLKPIIGMFGFSLAFALPFTLFALFPRWLSGLPKSGGWLNSVKVVLGFLELALGLKFLSIADQTYHWGILDREVYLAFWIVIFFLMGMYLLGKLRFAHDSKIETLGVPRLMLAIFTFTFVVYLIPGMFGAPLKALSGYLPPQQSHDFDLNAIIRENAELVVGDKGDFSKEQSICDDPKYSDFLHLPHGLKGYFDYEQGLKCAKQLNKPIFIDFTGHGCVNCREMEANVWAEPPVLKRLKEDYVIIALYVDDKTRLPKEEWITSAHDNKVKKTIGKKYADFQITRFNVNAQPYYVLLDTNGELLVKPRAYDLDVDEFVDFLDMGLEEFKSRKNEDI